jgi:hypothetical protein
MDLCFVFKLVLFSYLLFLINTQPRFELYDHKVSPRQIKEARILAGHLSWGTLNRMFRDGERMEDSHNPLITKVSSSSAAAAAKTNVEEEEVTTFDKARNSVPHSSQSSCADILIEAAPLFSCFVLVRHPVERCVCLSLLFIYPSLIYTNHFFKFRLLSNWILLLL